jgi:SWI/SNF-related matrix-associated actin-dependent regulator 1 of chromatin subfamily A
MHKFLEYQKRGIAKLIKCKGRSLLADPMGLGKTWQALGYIKYIKKKTIIVTPAHLKYHWEYEAWSKFKLKTSILESQTPDKSQMEHDIVIINYDILKYWKKMLEKFKAFALVFDECHYVKNRMRQRTRALSSLSRKMSSVIGISGTPMLGTPLDLFPTLNMIWPKAFPAFLPFALQYTHTKKGFRGRIEFVGGKNLKELHTRLKKLGMIRRNEKVAPGKDRYMIPLPLSNPKEYFQAENNFFKWLRKKGHNVQKAAKAEKLVQMGYLKRLAAQLKMESNKKWIDDFYINNPKEKLVVFCEHKSIINEMLKYYPFAKVINGNTKKQDRPKIIKDFQTNKKTKMLICNFMAGGVGITLTAAKTLIFIELNWVPALHEQAEDRINRISQKHRCSIYYLIAKDTIEHDLCKIIQKKHEDVSKVLEGKKIDDGLNLFDLLIKSYSKGKL